MLDIPLNSIVIEIAPYQSLGVKDRVSGIHGNLVLGGIANQSLGVGEGDIRGRGPVALKVTKINVLE